MHERLQGLLQDQCGVVSRQQALAAGLSAAELQRLVRRRLLVALHPGVYVDHTGAATWQQRAWAAVLACGPSALAGSSAVRAVEGPGSRRPEATIEVVVARGRHPVRRSGIRVRCCDHLEEQVLWHTGPPRQRYEEAVVDLAARSRSELAAVAELSAAVQSRCTTAQRLLDVLGRRPRIARRAFLEGVLADVAAGAHSVLEHGYLTRVERPHGLSGARRQHLRRTARGPAYDDVTYLGGALVVELDGRIHHDSAEQRDRDMDRDLDAAVDGRATVRLSYGQVFTRACLTAARIDRLLVRHGWTGCGRPCGPGCPVGRS